MIAHRLEVIHDIENSAFGGERETIGCSVGEGKSVKQHYCKKREFKNLKPNHALMSEISHPPKRSLLLGFILCRLKDHISPREGFHDLYVSLMEVKNDTYVLCF